MDEGFSGMVRLSNISDFISPAQNCIIPTQAAPRVEEAPLVGIRKKDTASGETKKPIKVSLNDCLACNGCVTSAETVLVEQQSLDRLWEGVAQAKLSVVTLSPQVVTAIAAARDISVSDACRLISAHFLSRGVHYVLDSSIGRLFSLEAAWQEYVDRKLNSGALPLLASACPGFVCYAEKSHGRLLVPLISTVRSPQAIVGALVKDLLSRRLAVPPSQILHASVMPCFDKKLEASRPDFYVPGEEAAEVRQTDCVISTAELNAALCPASDVLDASVALPTDWLGDIPRGNMLGQLLDAATDSPAGTSGGYAQWIVHNTLQHNPGSLATHKTIAKNLDVTEVISSSGERLASVARCYGFRNIQNVVRKLKTGKCQYDYVEVMACPSGCGNGGGQIRFDALAERDAQLSKLESLYSALPHPTSSAHHPILAEWLERNPECRQLLLTSYRPVETNIAANLNNW